MKLFTFNNVHNYNPVGVPRYVHTTYFKGIDLITISCSYMVQKLALSIKVEGVNFHSTMHELQGSMV